MSTADPDTAIRALQDRLATLQRARIRAEHERDQATAAATAARTKLAAEFGVESVTEAHTMLAALETELGSHLDALHAALDELGA